MTLYSLSSSFFHFFLLLFLLNLFLQSCFFDAIFSLFLKSFELVFFIRESMFPWINNKVPCLFPNTQIRLFLFNFLFNLFFFYNLFLFICLLDNLFLLFLFLFIFLVIGLICREFKVNWFHQRRNIDFIIVF